MHHLKKNKQQHEVKSYFFLQFKQKIIITVLKLQWKKTEKNLYWNNNTTT